MAPDTLLPAGTRLPPRLADALSEIRGAIARCDAARIPADTVLAALMTELMPRLVEAYGPGGTAGLLDQLAREVSTGASAPAAIQ